MKCGHCGAEYQGNFCPECGARAESQSSAAPPPIQQPTANRQTPVPPVSGNAAVCQKPKKPKKPIYKKWWFYVIAAIALIAIISAIPKGKGRDERIEDSDEKIEWSKIELRDQLPEPPSSKGTLYENSDEEFWVSLDGVTDDQYNDYLDACVDKGFTVDADKSSYSYEAYNADGYSLYMSHIGDGLSITLEAPMKFGSITWPSVRLEICCLSRNLLQASSPMSTATASSCMLAKRAKPTMTGMLRIARLTALTSTMTRATHTIWRIMRTAIIFPWNM